MKRIILLAAAAAIAATATPALAKSKKKYRTPQAYYGETYAPAPLGYWAGIAAPVAGYGRGNDPSLGHPSAGALSRASGRFVEDLGYGRYKYCGW